MTPKQLAQWIEASIEAFKAEPEDSPGDELGIPDTWISRTHKYFYKATPKVASSKIKIVLQQLEGYAVPPRPTRIHWRDTSGLSFVPSISDFTTRDAEGHLLVGRRHEVVADPPGTDGCSRPHDVHLLLVITV